jgi:hypothetical protein
MDLGIKHELAEAFGHSRWTPNCAKATHFPEDKQRDYSRLCYDTKKR